MFEDVLWPLVAASKRIYVHAAQLLLWRTSKEREGEKSQPVEIEKYVDAKLCTHTHTQLASRFH